MLTAVGYVARLTALLRASGSAGEQTEAIYVQVNEEDDACDGEETDRVAILGYPRGLVGQNRSRFRFPIPYSLFPHDP